MNSNFRVFTILSLLLVVFGVLPVNAASIDPGDGEPVPEESSAINEASVNYTGCGGVITPELNAAYEQQVVELVNAARWENGQLAPYKRVDGLDSAARYHAADMAQDDYFYHDSYDRNASSQLVMVCGWNSRIASYYSGVYGENIAAGYADPTSVMAGWMNSPGHKANILNTSSWEIGMGYSNGGGWGSYWVQDFGKRFGVYPLIINRESAKTTDRNASIYIYGTWTQMRLKNEGNEFSPWKPFQANSTWQLSACGGTKTVTAEMTNGYMTFTSSDSIELTPVSSFLGGLPDQYTFTYSIPDQRVYPAAVAFTPTNLPDGCPMTWTVTKTGNWFSLSKTSGVTPDSFIVNPSGFDTHLPATYNATITVSGPAGSTESPHQINLSLVVEDTPWQSVYLPSIFR